MQVYFGQRAHFYQTTAILDSNLEEAWGETKRHPRLFKNLETHQVKNISLYINHTLY